MRPNRKGAFDTYTIKESISYLSIPYLESNVVMLSKMYLLLRSPLPTPLTAFAIGEMLTQRVD